MMEFLIKSWMVILIRFEADAVLIDKRFKILYRFNDLLTELNFPSFSGSGWIR